MIGVLCFRRIQATDGNCVTSIVALGSVDKRRAELRCLECSTAATGCHSGQARLPMRLKLDTAHAVSDTCQPPKKPAGQ